MTIAFIHDHLSFLPEIEAYQAFFSQKGYHTVVLDFKAWKDHAADIDVEWMMMGTDISKRTSALRIHEYASSSAPPFIKLKNRFKSTFNTKPDFRLFLNEYVRQSFRFSDNIPSGIRDMGIDRERPVSSKAEKKYDFIYTGSVKADRKITNLLNRFVQKDLAYKTILILSRDYEHIANKYRHFSNIIFKGPVTKPAVAQYLSESRFAINYIPDHEPYNRQTSTKFLEYQQFNIPVITTDYPWLREFENTYGGKFFKIDASLKNLNWEEMLSFPFCSGNLSSWNWEKQIEESGVIEWLASKNIRPVS
jgi:glycosyltransferase involved in cell wall biosynthesis